METFFASSHPRESGRSPSIARTAKRGGRLGLAGACLLAALPAVSLRAQDEAGGEITSFKKLSLQELMDLEVTSVSRRPERFIDTASSIQAITGDDIRRSGATRIPEALRLANNLHVAQRGAQGWSISARGFNTELSNKLLVLMDGRTVYSPLFSGVFWDAQDYVLEDIDRIEVISGPGGSLWGANAVNGVININTKSARDTQGVYTSFAAGDELDARASVRYGGVLAPDVYFRVYGQFADRDGGALAGGAGDGADLRSRRGGFRIDSERSPQTTLTLQGDIYGIDHDLPPGETEMRGGNLLGRWTHVLENDSEMVLQAYYDRAELSQMVPASVFGPAGRMNDRLDSYDLDFQHRFFPRENHQVVWGLGYRFTRDVVDDAPGLGFAPARLDRHLYSAFAQDTITLGEGWALTLGSKIEHNDYTGFEFEPSARVQWNFTTDQMLWAAVSRAVRMPSRVDRDLRRPSAGPALLAGDSGFVSENVVAYELGYRARLGPRLFLTASAFFNRYDDLRSLGVTPVTIAPLIFENNLEGETYGVELDATFEVRDGWRLRGGYTLLRHDIRVKPGRLDINNALNENADPRHQVSLRSSWSLPGRVELDAGLRWVDSFRINNAGAPATVPDYAELDVRIAWRPSDELEISLVGQNLLHDRHSEYGVPGPANPEVERAIHAKLTWRY